MIQTPRTHLVVRTGVLVLIDLVALWSAWYIATTGRLGAYWGDDFRTYNQTPFLAHAALFLLAGVLFETYDAKRPYASWSEVRKLLLGYGLAGLAELLIFYFRTTPLVGRGIFALNVMSFVALAVAARVVYSFIGADFFKRRVIVVTSGDVSPALLDELANAATSVYDIQGYVAPDRNPSAPHTRPWLGDGSDLLALVEGRHIDTIIVSSNIECWHRYIYMLMAARSRGVEIVDFARTCERFLNRVPAEHVTELWLLWGLMGRSSFYVTRLKRLVDVTIAGLLLIPALPLIAVVAGAIRVTSKGPVLYTQERIGQHGRPFKLFKFRSMVVGAEDSSGPVWAAQNDSRVTSIGQWLRRWRLDEWPQLFNVLKGDMSLVGPRPERGVFVSEFVNHLPMYDQRHAVRPGITGWGQIHYEYAASREQTREKLEYDLFYVKNASLLLDLAILLRTTRTLVGGHGR